jgi:hypothetical protein
LKCIKYNFKLGNTSLNWRYETIVIWKYGIKLETNMIIIIIIIRHIRIIVLSLVLPIVLI